LKRRLDRRNRVEQLEARQMLDAAACFHTDATGFGEGHDDHDHDSPHVGVPNPPEGLPPIELGPEPFRPRGPASAPPPTAANGLPLLESHPAAPVAIYLDFDGFTGNGYGGQQTHNPYSLDADGANYNAQEQLNIIEGWERVAAYFAPFDVNVTTIVPTIPKSWTIITPSFGGPGYSWGQFNGFAPSSFNPQGDLLSRTTGILHEIGHDFGLAHQSEYDLLGNKTKEYRNGYDSLHGSIMGVDYDGSVPKWYIGHPANSPSALQDDIAIIASKIRPRQPAGGDGFRTDDHGDAIGTATVLVSDAGVQTSYGIIERLTDRDVFAFTSTGGAVSVDATRDSISGVDIKLEIYTAAGTLLAASDTTPNNQNLTVTLAPGTYYAAVSSHGDYSDIGPYNVTVQSLPANWLHQDVGNVGQAGYVRYDALTQTFAVGGGGTRIGETSDSFHFAYQQLTGDGEIVARVTAIENTNNSAKAGVMIRQSLANNSRHAYMLASTDSGIWMRSRTASPGGSTDTARTEATAPAWVRLVRTGNEIRGYYSLATERPVNEEDWIAEESATTLNDLPNQVYIGLATTASNNAVVNDSAYTNVTITGNVGTAPEVVNALPAPTNLAVTATTNTSIGLSWTAAPGATGYTVERSADGVSYSQVGTTNAATTTLDNTGLTSHQRYFYRVRSNDASGVSVASTVISAVTRPGAVTSFTVTSWNESQLILNWRDTSGESGYRIERATDGTNFSPLATLGINVPSHTDSNLTAGVTYTYRIVTLDSQGASATSSNASSSTRIAAPDFALSAITADQITLTWADLAGESEYTVERSTDGETFTALAALPAGTTTFNDTNVEALGEYYYRMSAKNGTIPGLVSEVEFAGTPGEVLVAAPWVSSDVGTVEGTGAAGLDNGAVTLISAGSDLSGTTDSMHFVRQSLAGDGTILARLVLLEDTAGDAEIGLMIRESLNNNSKSFAVVASPTEAAHLRIRSSTGGSSTTSGTAPVGPQWFKLTRAGNTFTALTSADGRAWTQVGNVTTISMAETVFIGLASTSGDADLLNTSAFDNVSIGLDGAITQSESVALDEDDAHNSAAPGVLANDVNFGPGSTSVVVDPPLHGEVVLQANGNLTYTPDANFFGSDSLTYRIESAPAVFVPLGARWRYLDNGSDQGLAWSATAFDDSAWESGPAELGFGDNDEETTIAGGPSSNRFATTYFRKSIALPVGASATDLSLRLRRDDAAAIYLNGVEVYRDSNLPAGADFDDYATSSIPNADENSLVTIPLSGSVLTSGVNSIAVELHQGDEQSSDLSFALELTGRYLSAPAMVSFEVRPTPDVPVAVDDSFEIEGGSQFSAMSPGVLTNDTDADGDLLTSVLRNAPVHGVVVLDADGAFRYTPTAGFTGQDSFSYATTDQLPFALVAKGSDWRYWDTGVDPGASWRSLAFDDVEWKIGAGELGYGDDDEATTVNCGPSAPDCDEQNFATAYFRRKFTVADPTRLDSLILEIVRDDAAAIYMNGQQIFRDDNLAASAGHGSFATGTSDENETTPLPISATMLVPGENILAVEIHQAAEDSSDLSFDLSLIGRAFSNVATVTLNVGSTSIAGDFNGDAGVDGADLDLLLAALQAGSTETLYDVTGDGQVTNADLDFVVTNLVRTTTGVGTRYGDVDLDGDVDRRDAALVAMQFGRMGAATWASGDWDGSGTTDLADLARLQTNFGPATGSPAASASAEAVVMKATRGPAQASRRARAPVAAPTIDSLSADVALRTIGSDGRTRQISRRAI
jgi:hypothetical protein